MFQVIAISRFSNFFSEFRVNFAARDPDPDPQIQLDPDPIFRHESMLCAGKGSKTLPYTHILDLAEDGFIKPHVDSARVGGGLINIFSKLAVFAESIFRFRLFL